MTRSSEYERRDTNRNENEVRQRGMARTIRILREKMKIKKGRHKEE